MAPAGALRTLSRAGLPRCASLFGWSCAIAADMFRTGRAGKRCLFLETRQAIRACRSRTRNRYRLNHPPRDTTTRAPVDFNVCSYITGKAPATFSARSGIADDDVDCMMSGEADVRQQIRRPAFSRIADLGIRYLPYGELRE